MTSDQHLDREWPKPRREGAPAPKDAAGWLSLAATPTFAVMALLTAFGGGAHGLCSSGLETSPLTGMAAMYLLMSVFHLAPWLKLVSRRH